MEVLFQWKKQRQFLEYRALGMIPELLRDPASEKSLDKTEGMTKNISVYWNKGVFSFCEAFLLTIH